jgi:hypothetical protein
MIFITQSNQEHRNILIKDSYVLYNVASPSSNEDFETLHYERLQ